MMRSTTASHANWQEFSGDVHICHQYVPSGAKVGRVAATCSMQMAKGFKREPGQLQRHAFYVQNLRIAIDARHPYLFSGNLIWVPDGSWV